MNTKAKGRRREIQSRNQYQRRGWIVTTSAASLGVDLHCSHPESGQLHYISVKSNTWPPQDETLALIELAGRISKSRSATVRKGWKVIIHRYDDRQEMRCREVLSEPILDK